MALSDYKQYGKEWEKGMMKWTKRKLNEEDFKWLKG